MPAWLARIPARGNGALSPAAETPFPSIGFAHLVEPRSVIGGLVPPIPIHGLHSIEDILKIHHARAPDLIRGPGVAVPNLGKAAFPWTPAQGRGTPEGDGFLLTCER